MKSTTNADEDSTMTKLDTILWYLKRPPFYHEMGRHILKRLRSDNPKANSRIFRGVLGASIMGIWIHLPASLRLSSPGQAYGRFVHALVRRYSNRAQVFTTYFLRNRAELELMRRLLDRNTPGSSVDISVLGCSKGAEVYSILWTIRSARPDLRLTIYAVDMSQEILEFAERGVYSRRSDETGLTFRDQGKSIFERLTDAEMEAMFEVEDDLVKVRPWLKEGIIWLCGDAGDPELIGVLGCQDIVVANRFLYHMKPMAAERCLRNVARLVKPGGYLFVSGIDLDVRTKVARAMGWKPVTDLMREIHEGDPSSTKWWPLGYHGLEPFRDNSPDWKIRYASVFQIGEPP
jgi:chemotaxis methyl-accepting protein methylase